MTFAGYGADSYNIFIVQQWCTAILLAAGACGRVDFDAVGPAIITDAPGTESGSSSVVAFDRTANSDCPTSPCTVTLTIGSGANRAIMVGLTFQLNTIINEKVSGAGASGWNPISGTDSRTGSNWRTVLWVAANPGTGMQTVTIAWSGGSGVTAGVVTASGVDQMTPAINGTFAVSGVSVTSMSLPIAAAPNDMTMDTVGTSGATNLAGTQTQRWELMSINGGHEVGGSTGSGAAVVTHRWTLSTAAKVAQSGADFKAAGS